MSFVFITAQDGGQNVKVHVMLDEILVAIFIDEEKTIEMRFKNRPFNDSLLYRFRDQALYNTCKLQLSVAMEKF